MGFGSLPAAEALGPDHTVAAEVGAPNDVVVTEQAAEQSDEHGH